MDEHAYLTVKWARYERLAHIPPRFQPKFRRSMVVDLRKVNAVELRRYAAEAERETRQALVEDTIIPF